MILRGPERVLKGFKVQLNTKMAKICHDVTPLCLIEAGRRILGIYKKKTTKQIAYHMWYNHKRKIECYNTRFREELYFGGRGF